jgi:hypothetical protein
VIIMSQPDRSDPALPGGVQNVILGLDFTAEAAAAQSAAESLDTGRRKLGSAMPGSGALLPLPQVPYGPSVGKWDLDLPAVGAGYADAPAPEVPPWQTASHGAERPLLSAPGELVTGRQPAYADDIIGGDGYAADSGQPALMGVRALADQAFAAMDRASGRGSDFVVISPDTAATPAPRRPGLFGRLAGKLRRK